MTKGVIKKIVSDRGFGFITMDEGGKDIFFHAKGLARGVIFDTLKEGQRVQFGTERGEKGLKAIEVDVI